MNNELKHTGNAVYSLNYHLIIVVKYRKPIFTNNTIVEAFKTFTKTVCEPYGVTIKQMECGTDHVHFLIETKPATDLCKFINILKGHSSRFLRKQFTDEISKQLLGDSFWSPSYFLASVGNTSLDTLMEYINNQRSEQL